MRQDHKPQQTKRGPNYHTRRECRARSSVTPPSCQLSETSVSTVWPDLLEVLELTPFRLNNRSTTLSPIRCPRERCSAGSACGIGIDIPPPQRELHYRFAPIPYSQRAQRPPRLTCAIRADIFPLQNSRFAIQPDLPELLESTSSLPNNRLTTPLWPFSVAQDSGVWSSSAPRVSVLTPSHANSSLTTHSSSAAHEGGGRPDLFEFSGLASFPQL